jgi:hypothetical protein
MTQKRADQTQKSQVDKFREAARELETDDSEANFDRMVKEVAKSNAPKRENDSNADQ